MMTSAHITIRQCFLLFTTLLMLREPSSLVVDARKTRRCDIKIRINVRPNARSLKDSADFNVLTFQAVGRHGAGGSLGNPNTARKRAARRGIACANQSVLSPFFFSGGTPPDCETDIENYSTDESILCLAYQAACDHLASKDFDSGDVSLFAKSSGDRGCLKSELYDANDVFGNLVPTLLISGKFSYFSLQCNELEEERFCGEQLLPFR